MQTRLDQKLDDLDSNNPQYITTLHQFVNVIQQVIHLNARLADLKQLRQANQ